MTNAVTSVLLLLFLWPGDRQPTTEKAKVAITMTGTVRDPAGAPIAKATVWLPTCYSLIPPELDGERGDGGAVTDAAGRYSFNAELRGSDFAELFERGVSVQADGFIRAELPYKTERELKAGDKLSFDVELTRGELLAGTIDIPLRLSERMKGVKEDERRYIVRVTGKSFVQIHYCSQEFELWVPQGAFDVEVVHDGQQARLDAPSASLKEVARGTRGMKLVKSEPVIEPNTLTQAFDVLWEDMFWYYSYFELKRVDWLALKSKYRPRAVASHSLAGFVDMLGEMLGELNDGHVWFLEPADAIVAHPPEQFVVDTNLAATEATIEGLAEIGDGFARIGTTRRGGFAVLRITRMSRADDAAIDEVIKFIKAQAGAPGFIVDLRGADGGSELVAHRIARHFCAKQRIYARSKYRGGADPGDFGPTYDRTLDASDKPYTKPVVCVLGPGCVSSGEAFAMMMQCLPNVTTIGRATRGSSGNPRPCTLPGVPVTVLYSRWVDMLPDGRPIEGRGIAPAVAVELSEEEYEKADPTWQKALVVLRDKVEEATDSKKVTP